MGGRFLGTATFDGAGFTGFAIVGTADHTGCLLACDLNRADAIFLTAVAAFAVCVGGKDTGSIRCLAA